MAMSRSALRMAITAKKTSTWVWVYDTKSYGYRTALRPVRAEMATQRASRPSRSATSGSIQIRYWVLNTRLVRSITPTQATNA
jgi:hypothetical protein